MYFVRKKIISHIIKISGILIVENVQIKRKQYDARENILCVHKCRLTYKVLRFKLFRSYKSTSEIALFLNVGQYFLRTNNELFVKNITTY
jgi:hypothetical protein